jgi:hypothetical protein
VHVERAQMAIDRKGHLFAANSRMERTKINHVVSLLRCAVHSTRTPSSRKSQPPPREGAEVSSRDPWHHRNPPSRRGLNQDQKD